MADYEYAKKANELMRETFNKYRNQGMERVTELFEVAFTNISIHGDELKDPRFVRILTDASIYNSQSARDFKTCCMNALVRLTTKEMNKNQ